MNSTRRKAGGYLAFFEVILLHPRTPQQLLGTSPAVEMLWVIRLLGRAEYNLTLSADLSLFAVARSICILY